MKSVPKETRAEHLALLTAVKAELKVRRACLDAQEPLALSSASDVRRMKPIRGMLPSFEHDNLGDLDKAIEENHVSAQKKALLHAAFEHGLHVQEMALESVADQHADPLVVASFEEKANEGLILTSPSSFGPKRLKSGFVACSKGGGANLCLTQGGLCAHEAKLCNEMMPSSDPPVIMVGASIKAVAKPMSLEKLTRKFLDEGASPFLFRLLFVCS
jgi:hypothetical protein